jgi:HEAT repeat protein
MVEVEEAAAARANAAWAIGNVAGGGEKFSAWKSGPVASGLAGADEDLLASVKQGLAAALESEDSSVRRNAAWALACIGRPDARAEAALRSLLDRERDREVQANACLALGAIGGHGDEESRGRIAGRLADGLGGRAAAAVKNSLAALAMLGDAWRPHRAAVLALLESKDPEVRTSALGFVCLGGRDFGGDAARVVPLLEDRVVEVQRGAAAALARIGEDAKGVVPGLRRALRDEDPALRANAAYALGCLGASAISAKEDLRRAAEDPDRTIATNAASALGILEGKGPPGMPARDAMSGTLRQPVTGTVQSFEVSLDRPQ